MPDQLSKSIASWVFQNVPGQTLLDNPAPIHNHQPVTKLAHKVKVMTNKDKRHCPHTLQMHEQIDDLLLQMRIQRRYGLVAD